MAQKLLNLLCQSQKIFIPNQKNFFRVQTRRQLICLSPLNRSLSQSAEELWRW